jgi:hypothetical protein
MNRKQKRNFSTKRTRNFWFGVILTFLFSLGLAALALAGFGVSPPYFRNENLARGSHYEKKIVLVRGDPVEDLKAEITIDVSGAEDWISIDKGTEFVLPKGEKQIPIVVGVDVPREAGFGNYKGAIRIKTSPLEPPEGGMVSIALGAQIDVDLMVTDKEIIDFKIRGVKASDLEEGHKLWWMDFPGKILFSMKIENLGNVTAGPSKVLFDIYDSQEENLLETIETTKIGKVNSFETGEVVTKLLTNLKPGSYWAAFKIFKGEEIISEGKISLSILPYGTMTGYKGAGFFDLPLSDQLIAILLVLLVVVSIGYGGYKGYKGYKNRKKAKGPK